MPWASQFAGLYADLRALACRHLQRERQSHTLQPTALVHEAYLRLAHQASSGTLDRNQLLGFASRVMRQVLVDYARTRGRLKRGGGGEKVPIDERHLVVGLDFELEALDEALTRLEAFDLRQARAVEMRFFGGMTTAEIAQVLGVSPETVKRDWAMARVWLHRELAGS